MMSLYFLFLGSLGFFVAITSSLELGKYGMYRSAEALASELRLPKLRRTQSLPSVDDLEETGYGAILGWWTRCSQDSNECSAGNLKLLNEPLYLDFKTCFSNPNFITTSVTFLGRKDGMVRVYEIIFTEEASHQTYKPTTCDDRGACDCDSSPGLKALRDEILLYGQCSDGSTQFQCESEEFEAISNDCWVPTTVTIGSPGTSGGQFICSMVAKIGVVPLEQGGQTAQSSPPSLTNESSETATPSSGAPPTAPSPEDLSDVAAREHTKNTAILGWWTECSADNFLCNGSLQQLDQPLYLDYHTCYVNPSLKGASVAFLGRKGGITKIYELNFATPGGFPVYRPKNCDDRGACDCSSSPTLQTARDAILAAGDCSVDKTDYVCGSKIFSGILYDECWVPTTAILELKGDPSGHCSMAAKVGQVSSDTLSEGKGEDSGLPSASSTMIPQGSEERFCTAFTGWYSRCDKSDGYDNLCQGNFTEIDPEYISFDKCYTNPLMDRRSVSFFGKTNDNKVKGFHLILRSDNDDRYSSLTCSSNGVCDCSQKLLELKDVFLTNGLCRDTIDYVCDAVEFLGNTSICFAPFTVEIQESGNEVFFACSLVAKIEQFGPCPVEASALIPAPTANPSITGSEGNSMPASSPAPSPGPATSVSIPPEAHNAFCTAILGWYSECKDSGSAENESSYCEGASYTPLDQPVFIDLTTCYTNPEIGGAVTFFGRTLDQKIILEFDMIFESDAADKYHPINCNADGTCECSPALLTMKEQFLDAEGCDDSSDYLCVSRDFFGETQKCFVPSFKKGTDQMICSMVADLQQFGPCEEAQEISNGSASSASDRPESTVAPNGEIAGEALYPQREQANTTTSTGGESGSGRTGWIVGIVIVLVGACTIVVLFVRRSIRRKNEMAHEMDGITSRNGDDDDVVWIPVKGRNLKFSRPPVNTEDDNHRSSSPWRSDDPHEMQFRLT